MLTNEQKEQRLNYLTGTDAPIICGLSPFCTRHELWEYKTRRKVQEDISNKPAVKAGIMLEGAIALWLAETIKKQIIHDDKMVISQSFPFMAGNIDGVILNSEDKEIVEIKTASSDTGWGDSGGSVIPRHYLMQVAHYLAVTDAHRCFVGVLIRGVDFRHYRIERDYDLEEMIIQKEKEFWSCVQLDIPPGTVYNKDLIDYLDARDAKDGSVLSKKDFKDLEKIFK